MGHTDAMYLAMVDANASDTATWTGAFLVFMPVMPIVATIISVSIFVIPWTKSAVSDWLTTYLPWLNPLLPWLTGSLLALLLWPLLALLYRRFTAVDRFNEDGYDSLCNRLSDLDALLIATAPDPQQFHQDTLAMLQQAKVKQPKATVQTPNGPNQPASIPPPANVPATPPANAPAPDVSGPREAVLSYRNAIYLGLMQQSVGWVTGSGYIKLWGLLNKAEETTMAFAPTDKVVFDAVYDEMRLNQSKIDNSQEWAKKLKTALSVIDPTARQYLMPATATSSPPIGPTPVADGDQQSQARAILQLVRETINDFDAKNWAALLQARGQLLDTMGLVGLATYVLVEFVMTTHANPAHLLLLTVFGFIGAIAGLFGRLYNETQDNTAIDDYNLATARLIVTPLLSALAAVIGILVVAKVATLNDLYNINQLLTNLILAATFGLTPNLLLDQLRKKADEYKGNLQSTQPTVGK